MRGPLSILVTAWVALAAPGLAHAYGWPLKPFDEQHAVRGGFDDPRVDPDFGQLETASFHFGIDISATAGTPVYAVAGGTAFREADAVAVRGPDGREFSYWHVTPAIPEHARVAEHQLLGWVKPVWDHVHFAERERGEYVNPLRPGALEPYIDRTTPTVAAITLQTESGAIVDPDHVTGRVDIVADAFDAPPVAPPPPWGGALLPPALVRWRLARHERPLGPWQVAADFGSVLLPPDRFGSVYAPGTRQNKPDRPGRYLFWLDRGLDTATLSDGLWELDVEASDLAGNVGTGSLRLTVANQSRSRTNHLSAYTRGSRR
ncbi:MAG: M23 family metallopeptidase [Gaiellaceae bacterium]